MTERKSNLIKSAQKAEENLIEKLMNSNLDDLCSLSELKFKERKHVCLKAFGNEIIFSSPYFLGLNAVTGNEVHVQERVLALKYILHGKLYNKKDNYISIRDFPGGFFYQNPFKGRTVIPLVKSIKNDLDLLEKKLRKFNWTRMNYGDFSAEIDTIENLKICLIYKTSDDEFPAEAEILFDSRISEIYSTEEAVVLASRVCMALL